MQNNKKRENRRNARKKSSQKENKIEYAERINLKSEESILWHYPISDNEDCTSDIEQETSADLDNFDNGESTIRSSFVSQGYKKKKNVAMISWRRENK